MVEELLSELGEEEPPCEAAHRTVKVCSGSVTHRYTVHCQKATVNVCKNVAEYVARVRAERKRCIGCGAFCADDWTIHPI